MARGTRLRLELVGLVPLALYALNAIYYFLRDEPWNCLWLCHLSCVWIGLGLILRSPVLNGIGLMWLCYGFPFWVYYLIFEGDLRLTSAYTHVGGMAASLLALRELGMASGTWRKAISAQLALMLVSRLTTPPEENVNVAVSVWAGFEKWFLGSYAVFFFANVALVAAFYRAIEKAGARFGPSPSGLVAVTGPHEPQDLA